MPEARTLDLRKSVHDLCAQHPELEQAMAELGFTDIVKPGMLNTAGRFMTIPKGAMMKRLDMGTIVARLKQMGYGIEGGPDSE